MVSPNVFQEAQTKKKPPFRHGFGTFEGFPFSVQLGNVPSSQIGEVAIPRGSLPRCRRFDSVICKVGNLDGLKCCLLGSKFAGRNNASVNDGGAKPAFQTLYFSDKGDTMENENPQATATSADNGGTNTPANAPAETPKQTKGTENNQPYKTFATQEDFDRHSAGILNSAQKKAEKELLALLGLKPDEKDKLQKFKEAYDATLSESEKKAKELESLKNEESSLKASIAEKDAIITAITKFSGKKAEDVIKFVKMAKGLVDENTTMEQALEQVLALAKSMKDDHKTAPKGTPPAESSDDKTEENPFKTKNLTEQGKLFKADPEKARRLYKEATGKKAPF